MNALEFAPPNNEKIAQETIERVAKLALVNTPHNQIAIATGISVNKITDVINSPKVQKKLQQLAVDKFEEGEKVNSGWDLLEEEALGNVIQAVRLNPDPEFSLKAAAMANKAQRRGNMNNPIDGKQSATATIELNINFIKQLQSMRIGMPEISAEAKRINTLDTQSVQHLFKDSDEVDMTKALTSFVADRFETDGD